MILPPYIDTGYIRRYKDCYRFTEEVFQDKMLVVEMINELKKEFDESGRKMGLYYFTFLEDDFVKNWITMRAYESALLIRNAELNVPESVINYAIEWVIKNNPHLEFGEPKKGHAGDDFIQLKMSAVLPIKR